MAGAIHTAREGRLARVTLDRPPLNVLDLETLAELDAAVAALGEDPAIHVVVIAGGGERAFSAGVAVEDHTPEKVPRMLASFHSALRRIWELDAVTVAAVEGHCLGGGMELAAVCDLAVASESSRFGQPEIQLGCYPPAAAALYPSLLGSAVAADLLLTGRTLSAAEARELGFLARLWSEERFAEELEALTDELLSQSAAVSRLTKKALRAGRGNRFLKALGECERIYLGELTQTRDMEEGLTAFLEKRPPSWHHE